ncbi:MAG TPA: serine protease [Thermoanaerobaculia bacterium]|nr:serine protease [Thermoanaerobaculia bacterium]
MSGFDNLPPDDERLCKRAALLTAGVFATIGDGDYQTREGGSGIRVAPFLALTARHVTDDLYRLAGYGPPRHLHQSQHAAHLFQALDPLRPAMSAHALWRVNRSWTSPHTDISLLQVSAEDEGARTLQSKLETFFEWSLCAPPIGATVWAIGYPRQSVTPAGKSVDIGTWFTSQELHVTKVYSDRRDRGMLNFPCFEVEGQVDPGFSGGPVFYQGKLCGIVSSGSSFDERSHIALLWPLALMDYSNEFKRMTRFGDLLDRRTIVSDCWKELKTRIYKGEDELGNSAVFIAPVAGSNDLATRRG